MAITNAFTNAIAAGNIRRIRIMMKDSLLVDPTFAEFKEMERFSQTLTGLYDEHDGRLLENDRAAWNTEYMNKMMVQIVGNFSSERIEHLQNIVQHLHPAASYQPPCTSVGHDHDSGNRSVHAPLPRVSQRSPYQQQKHSDQQDKKIKLIVGIGAGAVAGGIVCGSMEDASIAEVGVGVMIGTIVVGVAVYIASNRR